jgi:hypothetical protein
MLENPPEHLPRMMPMTAAIAPAFSARYPEIAIIFDNLHAMHDVISDILASPKVPQDRKRAEILTAAAHYRDSSSFAMSRQEWSEMARMVGVANMGGPAVGFLPAFATPTVPRGATMAEAMKGMDHGAMDHAAPATGHDSTAAKSAPADKPAPAEKPAPAKKPAPAAAKPARRAPAKPAPKPEPKPKPKQPEGHEHMPGMRMP